MTDVDFINLAYMILKQDGGYLEDAIKGKGTGNTVAGSVLALVADCPRRISEAAIEEALLIIDYERREAEFGA